MSTNHYFNNYAAKNEQRLVEDLIVESIKIMGTDVFYIPNTNDQARDLIYGEDPLKTFTTAFQIEVYPSNVMDYDGERELFGKFGLEIRNQVTVIMSKRSFTQRIPQNTYSRPREGDLIYVPFLNGTGELYEIKFTNQNKDFFMLGRKVPYFYEIQLEKFKYSQEVMETGIPDIDIVATNSAYTIVLDLNPGLGDYVTQEVVYQSPNADPTNANASGVVQDWNALDNTLTISNIVGVFADNSLVYGATSNAQHYLSTYDPLNTSVKNEIYDNKVIQTEGDNYIDNTTSNPFGSL